MPALKKDRIAAPPRMNTDAGLIKDTSRLNSEANTARLNTDLRSFMDQGDANSRLVALLGGKVHSGVGAVAAVYGVPPGSEFAGKMLSKG